MNDECSICTETFDTEALEYPLTCPGKCGFNFCTSCLDHLIESSKTDYEEASDGSRQVKVKLSCPQCRADLSKVGPKISRLRQYSKISDLPDSDLTASELRLKHTVIEESAKKKGEGNPQSSSPRTSWLQTNSSDDQDYDDSEFVPPIDKRLLRGLDFAMTREEQLYVQQLMYSGDADRLAQATQLLSSIQEMAREGLAKNTPGSTDLPSDIANADPKTAEGRAILMSNQKYARFMSRYNKHWKTNPLPARMPVHLSLELKGGDIFGRRGLNFPIKFAEDEWDGSIADAFNRVLFRNGKFDVERERGNGLFGRKKNLGSGNQEIAKSDEKVFQEGTPHNFRRRLRVSKITGPASGKGVFVGDVLTHINGEKFQDGGIEELNSIIQRQCAISQEAGDEVVTFSMEFNAEPAVAAALKKRGATPPPYFN